MAEGAVVVIGGTSGLGREVACFYAGQGREVVVSGRAVELAPIRVNAIHPAIVGDSPYWSQKPEAVLEGFRSRTPLGRLVSMQDIVGAVAFLLENRSVTGVNLPVDGGWLLM